MDRKVYLDYAATTYVNTEVLTEMLPTFSGTFGNSSSLHSFGRDANAVVDTARERIAKAINCKPNEVYFTSCGTEANNWAILGIAEANKSKGKHIITSAIEHHSVMDACHELERRGFRVTYLPVDDCGLIRFDKLLDAIDNETILISIMTANNEIGTIQHLQAIARTAKEKGIIFHTDAVQAFGAINIDTEKMGIDAMSLSAHKIYGPKGIGALYVKRSCAINPLILGGNQEYGKRAGTVNVPAVAGFGKASQVASRDLAVNTQKLKVMREYLVKKLTENIEDIVINGHPNQKLNSIVSVTFKYIEAESIQLMLDMQGIAVSTGSACTSGSVEPSYVLKAIGKSDEEARGTIRFSLGKGTSKDDIDYCVEKLTAIVSKLREMSPLTKKSKGGK